ncbi:ATP synthase F0 subunit B [candidate division WOR-1 bacterium RIFOXYA12_FULL_52_29]|uniref:ATP synthase subunit b n=1 Tax=candidate division WOR-1 bacterium RIFOXYC12_FULL_54_18 TaxID=1802584 RepID=A0A1F4T733_UNCSA|nr:MAG: ATP synthase F0 subunit B [candidate division WOR-1 bacterium RIFOXYA2_FULL_51_19]OGC18101.1 MAG: ATP synthase F0 subunit B [candidate division WOR-1 bacterium RIFOXYA12_FULL_52_29]OGC26957.1 MAG: ATP synthase F0 subunit B [candidate division WOR-1 bacterium RIFOXYB2_FULL_45_9]OGC28518.1 MAG: ATP synthase F0 subunit B [candidate division WOR-1 bacterium RIFOXYC12_FULL_54_18]OGC31027.1 MAG: ATP synthase F0 subunit B [candidate division WOR-1 bacterium RIFOXYB12_FULL_52_16]
MFELETGLIFWTLVSFGVLLLLLRQFVLPALINFMEEREAFFAKRLADSEKIKKDTEVMLRLYEERMKEASKEVTELKEEARLEAQILRNKLVTEARLESKALRDGAMKEIAKEQRKALEEIRDQSAALIAEATSKVIKKALTAEDQHRLVAESLRELEKEFSPGS